MVEKLHFYPDAMSRITPSGRTFVEYAVIYFSGGGPCEPYILQTMTGIFFEDLPFHLVSVPFQRLIYETSQTPRR